MTDFSQDGRRLCIGTNRRVVVYDQETDSLKVVFTPQTEELINSLDFSRDRNRRQLCISTDKRVVIYDQEMDELKTILTLQNEEEVWPCVVFRQDGRQLCIRTDQRVVILTIG